MTFHHSESRLVGRRTLLRQGMYGGVTLVCSSWIGLLTACSESNDPTKRVSINVSTDTGAVNWLYAVLQLETDLYWRVASSPPYPGMLTTDQIAFGMMLSAANSQSSSLQQALGGRRITDALLFSTGSIVDFSTQASLLMHAEAIAGAVAETHMWVRNQVTTSEFLDVIDAWTNTAVDRFDTIRAMQGKGAVAITPTEPATVLDVLKPYYLTTITVTHS